MDTIQKLRHALLYLIPKVQNTILITLATSLGGFLAIIYWTTNRQTQITKSKSQQKQKRSNGNETDETNFRTEAEEEQLYFNDWTRSDERRQLMHSFHGDDDDDDDDDSDDNNLEASDDEDSDNGTEFDLKPARDTLGEERKPLRSSSSQKMRKDLFQAISKLKVFSYLSDEAFLQCLQLMEYVEFAEVGMDVFQNMPYDGSLYVVIEGRVDIYCSLQSPNEKDGEQPMRLSAGPGDLLTSLLSALSGLIEAYDGIKGVALNKVNVRAITLEKNTRLIRIPPRAFVTMLESYPHDVHQIAQTILARCQRVTVPSLVKNLGIGLEILYTHGESKSESETMEEVQCKEKAKFVSIAKDILRDHYGKDDQSMKSVLNVNSETKKKIATLVSQSLGSTDPSVIETITNHSSIRLVESGEVIVLAETKSEYIYVVLDGCIEVCTSVKEERGIRNISLSDANANSSQILYKVFAGDNVGQMSCFTDEVSFVTLRSSTNVQGPALLLQLPKTVFQSLVDEHPTLLIECIRKILTVDFSPLVHLFEWGIDWKHVQAGASLATQGDICDTLQVILSGRLRAVRKSNSMYMNRIKDEYGRGCCLGEALVILGAKWPFDVYAIRNSEIAVLPVNVLEYIMHLFPHTAIFFAKRIAERKVNDKRYHKATHSFSVNPQSELSIATLAVVPLCFDSAPEARDLCSQIASELQKIESCALMTKSIARKKVGSKVFKLRNAVHELKMSRLLGDLEENRPLNVYQTDSKFTWWTKLCVQQADCVLLVIDGQKVPSCMHLETYLKWAYDRVLIRHVQVLVLQEVKETRNDGIADVERVPISHEVSAWIESRNFIENQHLLRKPVKSYENDVARICRRITGRSLGLALGGGGARGLAHLGVIRALMERGVTVDICGGTSQGAFIGALYAKNPDSYILLEKNCRKMALAMSGKKEKILDLTLPIVSYFNGKGFNKGIIDCIGKDTAINDLVLNFFCTSTDLCRSAQVIHTKGLCWKYVRASMGLHGYLPPIAENGQLLVDGGYTNLVPGDIMLEEMNAKAVICVDVSKETNNDEFYDYGTSLNGFWLMLNSWNPFAKTVRVLSMGDLSQRLIWVQSTKRRSEVMATADLWLSPPVSQYGVLEYDKFDEIVQKGYEYAVPLVDTFIKDNSWVVS